METQKQERKLGIPTPKEEIYLIRQGERIVQRAEKYQDIIERLANWVRVFGADELPKHLDRLYV